MSLEVGALLPDVMLPSAWGGSAAPLRSEREAAVLFRPHDSHCDACQGFLAALHGMNDDFLQWDARLIVVPADYSPEVLPLEPGAVVVADRYGQVFYRTELHASPRPAQICEWLKHLGTLCPE